MTSSHADLLREVQTWKGLRRKVALSALHLASELANPEIFELRDETNQLVSIHLAVLVSDEDIQREYAIEIPPGSYIRLHYLATREPGWGRKAIDQALSYARSLGMGIVLHSNGRSVEFYEHIGLTRVKGSRIFYAR